MKVRKPLTWLSWPHWEKSHWSASGSDPGYSGRLNLLPCTGCRERCHRPCPPSSQTAEPVRNRQGLCCMCGEHAPGGGQWQGRQEQKIGTEKERDKTGGGEVRTFSHRKPLELVHLSGQVGSVLSHWEALHSDRQPSRTSAKVSLSLSLYTKKSCANANCNIMRFIPTCTF